MKKLVAVLCTLPLTLSTAVACTPKPVSAEPVVEDFIEAMETQNTDAFGELVDDAADATRIYDATYAGLQAEGVDFELQDVQQDDSLATAHYTVSWDLPRERELTYDASMTLSQLGGEEWTVRWQPSLLHPDLGAHQHLELRAIEAKKASVVSSDGVELMSPGLQYRLVVDTDNMGDPRATAGEITAALNSARSQDDSLPDIDRGELADSLEKAEGSYSVTMLNEQQAKPLKNTFNGLQNVRLNEEPALITRDKGLAPDILSRVRSLVFDDIDGASGWSVSVVNQNGAALSDVERSEPSAAPAIRVGLDYDVQRAAQEAVNQRADSEAMLVAIRPSTGEILAVAQTEEADKNGDVALQGQYPPGSVFKIITAAAGVDRQGLNGDSIVPCPGTMDIYGRTVTNYNGFSLGSVPLNQAFAQSCNTTFADMSVNLDQGELKDIGKHFGLGLDYEIPGLSTITGQIPEGETPLEKTEAGYGQGLDLASPFGMALVSATVANGKTPVPQLVSTEETEVSEDVEPLPPHVLDNLRGMMRQVVTSGTAAGMQAGGEIYGKTGEAEINEGSHAWFTGFRDDDIAFATLVVLGGGSEVSVAITDSFFQKLDEHRAEPSPEDGAAPLAEE